ncbi:AraC family transcriptional regulator [Blastococcus tunisiensis]|uniref:AraC-type DNA-binding protein n=1 Tax=Blastococcus tunisiensis TaxID=1798228 RepID=A0A1I2HYT9_9ACTN|nr:AraC family transcriptional regulator [Blastococcus sp. DSM 46838]SFF35174.1 AraC-type DNA-binding protein [Blastococcus sp. DSM 46838]
MARRSVDGVPVYGYARLPGVPSINVVRTAGQHRPAGGWTRERAHAHDFLVLAYAERGGGRLQIDGRTWSVGDGDAFVVAPGEVVTPEWDGAAESVVWSADFPADALDPRTARALQSWRAHPLLFPFVGRRSGGVQRLRVPAAARPRWSARFAELDGELRERGDGYAEAAPALLTLLLVDLARVAADVPGHLRLDGEPLLAEVFDVIERRFPEAISLRDVAAAVGLSPGHLTTLVGRRTGRTVQQWITERRLAEARRLLVETDATVASIAARTGYRDAGYLTRRFRAAYGTTPQAWRRAPRPQH